MQSSAIYRGVLSLLALKGAMDFDTNQTLELARSNHKDHIFPRSEFYQENDINSVLNMTWMSDETNIKKGAKRPSQFVESFLREKYSGNEKKFQEMLETHFINLSGYQYMLQDDFEGFIASREQAILSEIRNNIGIRDTEEKLTLISPGKPFTNRAIMLENIRSREDYIHWLDKYFSNEGLDFLAEAVNRDKVKSIKILTSIPNTNLQLRKSFERLKEEMKNENIACELRVLANYQHASKIHDRWILSGNGNFNIPSPDTVARGQLSELERTENTIPFADLWKEGLDILSDWIRIEKAVNDYSSRKIR